MNFSNTYNRVLVTGGSGFIGGALIRKLLTMPSLNVFNLDKLSYASNSTILYENSENKKYQILKTDLCNSSDTQKAINLTNPDIIFHLAAETHVDRSISGPKIFLESNVIGTFNLLESVRNYWDSLAVERKKTFKFIHISTDEVFGSLGLEGTFTETSPYNPSSPYSASKAASDHFVKAWNQTYGIPTIVTNSSNNFGPWQFPEKLIPIIILKAIANQSIPIYGDGKNIRDWIYVEDHIDALINIALNGKVGDSYCIGGTQEKSNDDIVEIICSLLDSYDNSNSPHNRFKVYVKDRLGHDRRYAVDTTKLKEELKWYPKYNFMEAMSITVKWYLNNIDWCRKQINLSK